MKEFTENERYNYPLTSESIVFDIGAHKGTFTKTISDKYGCRIFAFEPIDVFYEQLVKVTKEMQNVVCLNVGLGASDRKEKFRIKGDMTGRYADSEKESEVDIRNIGWPMELIGLKDVDLIKINIEGGEFELLEYIIGIGLQTKFKNIQVQFHPVVPLCQERYNTISSELLKTHQFTYCERWVWENYERL